jgi:hypothetical protein
VRAASSSRRRRSNPSRRRRSSGRRRHRRNPGIPIWAQAGIAAGLALATYAGVSAGSFALTQRLDPSLATLERNRYVVESPLSSMTMALRS